MKQLLLFLTICVFSMCDSQGYMEHEQWEQDKLISPYVMRQLNKNQVSIDDPDSSYHHWEERKLVALEEGFFFEQAKNETHSFYSVINIDNPKLWKLAKRLLDNINGDVYVVYHLDEEKVIYGTESPIKRTLDNLDKIKLDILNNCNVNIGIVQDEKEFNEVYINDYKYIQCWGTNEAFFREVMKEFQLIEKPDLKLASDYPVYVYDWNSVNNFARTDEELINYLRKVFGEDKGVEENRD